MASITPEDYPDPSRVHWIILPKRHHGISTMTANLRELQPDPFGFGCTVLPEQNHGSPITMTNLQESPTQSDIELVMELTHISDETARKELIAANGDIVKVVMDLDPR
jgi:NACalpha-BTF3-like transcription factor